MLKSLIEQWFPAAAVGAESLRERGAVTAFPPTNFLHVWWARRPLAASRATLLATLLPAWPSEEDALADEDAQRVRRALQTHFRDGEAAYHRWFLRAVGIMGDPVKGRADIKAAIASGTKTNGNAYGYERAFNVNPRKDDIELVRELSVLGNGRRLKVLDPFAGGGSIPFEARRLGLDVIANELNPVASSILEGTVALPFIHCDQIIGDVQRYGNLWAQRVKDRLISYYPDAGDGTQVTSYIWAHAVPCPTTGYLTPLSPNYWIDASAGVAVRIEANEQTGRLAFDVVYGKGAQTAGDRSTYKNGTGVSVWTNEPFDGDYIRSQAQAGRMEEVLLAVVYTAGKGRQFRTPSQLDVDAIDRAKFDLANKMPAWEADDLVPTEKRFVGPADRGAQYGITYWKDAFAPRQLLCNITLLEELLQVSALASVEIGEQRARSVALYLAFALDKAVDYNSRFCSWHSGRGIIRNTFDRHDFSFKWSFAEMEGARELVRWVVGKELISLKGLSKMANPDESIFGQNEKSACTVTLGSATSLELEDGTIDAIVTDPPYYDNVMYAECADFFYVWMKRALRKTWPDFCRLPLTDKDREAVANPALFKDVATHRGSGKRASNAKTAAELADERYEQLLTESFKEAHRVLKEDGVMTVMFTHKRVDAWDTLGMALLESGFCIESSWPVHTESENSLHQAKKNSASSTILLTCRKRQDARPAFWGDIRGDIERVVERSVARFAAEGITGVDLTLATYGPALSVLSRNWPVYTGDTDANGTPLMIRPDVALDLARERVAGIKKRGLLGGRQIDFDRPTDWWLLAWSDFQAREFPSGEALKLSIATHLNLDDLSARHHLLSTSGGSATILTPQQRRAAKAINPDAKNFNTYIDALHTFMLIYDEDGLAAARAWLKRTGYFEDQKFHELVRAALNAVPRSKMKGKFTLPEAQTLDGIRANLFEDIPPPAAEPEQLALATA